MNTPISRRSLLRAGALTGGVLALPMPMARALAQKMGVRAGPEPLLAAWVRVTPEVETEIQVAIVGHSSGGALQGHSAARALYTAGEFGECAGHCSPWTEIQRACALAHELARSVVARSWDVEAEHCRLDHHCIVAAAGRTMRYVCWAEIA